MDVLLLADCLIYYTDLFYADRLKYHMKISLRKTVIVLLLIFILVAASSWAVQFYYLTYCILIYQKYRHHTTCSWW